jgi:HD-GYP domain-containing protein (c-di-GMP phosphodiesterase class II)
MGATLSYRDADGADRTLKLGRRIFRIGRFDDNDLVLDNPYISRYHAEIHFDGETYLLRDLDSTSGTFVNGGRVQEQNLADGDYLRLGKARGVEFTFHSTGPETKVDAETDDDDDLHTICVIAPDDARFINTSMLPAAADLAEDTVDRLRALYEFTSQSLVAHSQEELCATLSDYLLKSLKPDRCAILLYSKEKETLELAATRTSGNLEDVSPSLGISRRAYSENIGVLSIDATNDERFAGHVSVQFQSIRSVMAAPIGSKSRVWGVCYVDNLSARRAFEEEELEFLTAMSRQTGLALENLFLLDEQRRSLESFIRTLSASIGARDDGTAGHSARVGNYSSGIARSMGLGPRECRMIYYAGLLHDYGKIGIRDDVLLKPAELTAEEYEHVKEHPLHTFRILSKIRFPADLSDIPLVAAAHHERWDGTGYPHGLRGEEIPLGSRIVAVADAFDALVEERPYHEGIGPDEAVSEITERSGMFFDPVVVDAFVAYYEAEIATRLRSHAETRKSGH